nr:PHB depolymerase family esterase [Streptococcus loxodontisalivarius]
MVASSQDALPNKIVPVLDTFSEKGSVANLQYAAYQAPDSGQSRPLIVWLHGVGEVGTDISMPLLSNEVVALTQDQVQSHFSTFGTQTGADVLVLQSPQAWSASSASSVKAAIDSYLANHPSVDSDRIYLVGASNGAGMVLNMGVTYPNYFAALVPIASGYSYQNTSTEGQESYSLDATTAAALKDQPMWMIHARTDTTYPVDTTILPFYKALLQSGASNKWLSYFETVTGSDFGVEYNGHWSWIYFFNGQVTGVQNTDNAKNSEGLYGMVATDATHGGDAQASSHGMNFSNIFDWMSAQSLTSRAQ